jgi:hypothetical protein
MANSTSSLQYPFGTASVNGAAVTVDMMLQQPTRVTRAVNDIALQNFWADRLFSTPGGVSGGTVLFDVLTANDLYPTRDVQNVEPGAEFPIVGFDRPTPQVAQVEKFGGKFFVTDEAQDRNDMSQLRNGTRKVANAVNKGIHTRAVNVVDAAATTYSRTLAAANTWTTATTTAQSSLTSAIGPAAVFAAVQLQADTDELGVTYDSFIVNPTQASKFVMFYGANNWRSILDASSLTMYSSNRVSAGTAYFFEEGGVGEMRFEKPLSSESWREHQTERTWVQTSIRPVMYVTNPYSLLKVTGL